MRDIGVPHWNVKATEASLAAATGSHCTVGGRILDEGLSRDKRHRRGMIAAIWRTHDDWKVSLNKSG